MDVSKQIIYPKVTPVYVKLLQIGVAVILFFMILNLSVMSVGDSDRALKQHFDTVAKQQLAQAINSSKVILDSDPGQLQSFVNALVQNDFIEQAIIYDKRGDIVASSASNADQHSTINELFGVTGNDSFKADSYVPFIDEIRTPELRGYLRLNIVKSTVVEGIQQQVSQQFELYRLMLLTALVTGFLLTRGLSRFSRHGIRLPQKRAS
ncbi:AhpA/YtjB family protein [Thalassotalea ponticola]|uniref:AhpA/YtjB family protein n=1 Tax=Thalassotalea ponticola TaxID=1523392 RepID=UPI0025B5CBB1|nr:AhpA/YtjB family protein [Thalassotalea ponticola]MDN3653852.1 AhpA/YtjB family protein [Thalassotalea ponticola]